MWSLSVRYVSQKLLQDINLIEVSVSIVSLLQTYLIMESSIKLPASWRNLEYS